MCLAAVGLGPMTGRYRTLTVLTSSMAPTAPPGSTVIVTPLPPAAVRIGDVITFHAPDDGRVVTHRVVEIVEPGAHPVVRTKGDASTAVDPWVARLSGDTAWKLRAVVPGTGRVTNALQQPATKRVATTLLPLLLALVWLADIWAPKPASPAAAPAVAVAHATTVAAPARRRRNPTFHDVVVTLRWIEGRRAT